MADTFSTSLNLDIPQTPETLDTELFKELLRVYNSLQIIAQAIGDIQSESTLAADATDLPSAITLVNEIRSILITAKLAS